MKPNNLLLSLVGVFTLVCPGIVTAAPLTFSPTPTGITVTIENQGLVAAGDDLNAGDSVLDTYKILVSLTTDTSYADAAPDDFLAAFSVDLSGAAYDAAALKSFPAVGTWTLSTNQEVSGNSANCQANEPGAVCVEETADPANNLKLDLNGTYSWLFWVDIGSAGFATSTILEFGPAELKVTGPPSNRSYSWQGAGAFTATAGSLAPPTGDPPPGVVPEPGSLVLLGSGLVLAASRIRRRIARK